jgi:putative ABC transport system permease protein
MPNKILQSAALVGIFILVIAAVNFINLTTAKSVTRSKEVGVRKVMGSSRVHIIVQFIYEHSLMIVVTLLISLGLSQLALEQLNSYLASINLTLAFTWMDAGRVLLIGCAVIILAAVYPALVLASFNPINVLKNNLSLGRQSMFSLRRSLIVFQFTVVQLLVIATIIVAQQINHMTSADLGFTSKSIVSMAVPSFEKRDGFRNKLSQLGNVIDVTYGSSAPMPVDDSYGTSYRLPQQPEVESIQAIMNMVDVNYLSFFNIELIAGRNISVVKPRFDEFIVNEKLIGSMGWTPEQALGRRLVINEGEATIVGVVKDFQNQSLRSEIQPYVMMNGEGILSRAYVRVSNPSSATLTDIEKSWKEFAPEKVFSSAMLSDSLEQQYGLEMLVFHGFTTFSLLAIIIGCLGLFGLSSFMAVRRAKEIGIRKVLGASVSHIVSQFSREFVWMVVIGFFIASPIAWMIMRQWLQEFANHIDIAWWMFAAGGGLALAIALATVSFHSVKVGTANPVDSLKNE